MVGIAKIIAATLVAVCAYGCGKPFQWEGHWVGNRQIKPANPGEKDIAYIFGKIDLTIHGNGRFDLLESAMPKSGRFRTSGDRLLLQITHVLDRPIESMGSASEKLNKEIILTQKSPNEIEFQDPGGFDHTAVTLKRESQPDASNVRKP